MTKAWIGLALIALGAALYIYDSHAMAKCLEAGNSYSECEVLVR